MAIRDIEHNSQLEDELDHLGHSVIPEDETSSEQHDAI